MGDQTGIQGRLLPADIAAQFIHVQIQISKENLVGGAFPRKVYQFFPKMGNWWEQVFAIRFCLNMGIKITMFSDDESDYRYYR